MFIAQPMAANHGIHLRTGITETTIQDLVTVNNRLYARTDRGIVQSVDGGEVWETVGIEAPKQTREGIEEEFSPLHLSLASQLETAGDVLYGIAPGTDNLRLFQLSVGDNTFVPVQRAPTFEREFSSIEFGGMDRRTQTGTFVR